MKAIYSDYLKIKAEQPRAYARDLAQQMNISEAELLHGRVGHGAERLRGEIPTLLAALVQLGEIKAITRNQYAVHEQIGTYINLHLGEDSGLVLNPSGLNLRLFPGEWASAFSLREMTTRGERQSLQFFNPQGESVHKIYATPKSDITAWQSLLADFTSKENPPLVLSPAPASPAALTVVSDRLEREWRAMTDVHQFASLLMRHRLTRQQAFRAVGNDLAQRVDNGALRQILMAAQQERNEIMIFVANGGCMQIYTGAIARVTLWQNWLNAMTPGFTLHLVEDAIDETWITRKPTRDGMVTSLELFAADGTQIAQLFGQRSEGQPEQSRWRAQIGALTAEQKVL